jgi:hypothetical protein
MSRGVVEGHDALALALAFFEAPGRFPDLLHGRAPLPSGMTELLQVAAGDLPEGALPPIFVSLPELQKAALFFIDQVLLARGADHCRVMGLAPGAAADEIKEHHRLLMRLFHPDRLSAPDEQAEAAAARINRAYAVLRGAESRAAYYETVQPPAPAAAPAPATYPRAVRVAERQPGRVLPAALRRHMPALVLGSVALVAIGAVAMVYFNRVPPGAIGAGALAGAPRGEVVAPLEVEDAGDPAAKAVQGSDALPPLAPAGEPVEQARSQRENAVVDAMARVQREAAGVEVSMTRQRETTLVEAPPRAQVQAAVVAASGQPQRETTLVEAPPRAQAEAAVVPAPTRPPAQAVVAGASPASVAERGEPARDARPAQQLAAAAARVPAAAPVTAAAASAPATQPVRSAPAQEASRPAAAAAPVAAVAAASASSTIAALPTEPPTAVLQRFVVAYERGDLEGLMALFDEDARIERGGRARIRKDYEALFRDSEMRSLRLRDLRWSGDGELVRGEGAFVARVVRRGEDAMRDIGGSIRIELVKRGDRLLIIGLYHTVG